MRNFRYLMALGICLVAATLVGFSGQEDKKGVVAKDLRAILVQLGYEVTDIGTEPGKEKYSVKVERDGLNIPVGCEVSPSGGYIWFTANLGDAPAESSPKCLALLKQNALVQPTQFYVTKSNRMMIASPLENQQITNVVIRSRIDGLADTIAKTKTVWQ